MQWTDIDKFIPPSCLLLSLQTLLTAMFEAMYLITSAPSRRVVDSLFLELAKKFIWILQKNQQIICEL